MQSRHSQFGYTLIELLLYCVIVSSLLIGATSFFALTSTARIKAQTASEVDQQGAMLMEAITHTIRNATSITAPTIATTGTSLTLVVPTSTSSPTVFNLSGTTAQITEGTAAAVALTNSNVTVSNLSFTNMSRSGTNGIVRVSFILSRVNTLNRQEFDYQKTFTSSAVVRW